MFLSLALILLMGLVSGEICKKIHLPPLIGMLAVGIVIGPHGFNLLDGTILGISPELRKIALIIILTRAGLSLDISELKKIGRPAVMMCFVPACFEIIGMTLLAPVLLPGISCLEGAIMGAVIAAVSPAVIVPKMIKLNENGYGTDKGVPSLIMAGASVDDIFVIVMFSAFVGLEQTGRISALSFVKIPVSIISGIISGVIVGLVLCKIFEKIHIGDTTKIVILLSLAFLFVSFEDRFGDIIPFSSLIGVMCIGISIKRKAEKSSKMLSDGYNRLWIVFETVLFVLVGASVDFKYAVKAGGSAVILILAVLIFRMTGVLVCLIKTKLLIKERLFCMPAYIPKATVQAAIGGIPLAMGLKCGEIVLTVAVLSIILTAPLGALLIDTTYKKLLNKNE